MLFKRFYNDDGSEIIYSGNKIQRTTLLNYFAPVVKAVLQRLQPIV